MGRACWWLPLPFAFQYGRITGWYCFCMFLAAWLTWAYLRILDDRDRWSWVYFGIAALLMVWSNYFGVVLLLLFLADLAIFHRKLATKHLRCKILGEYRAAPDPAAMWKARFAKDSPILAYRTNVIWYDCPR